MTRFKICGLRRREDIEYANEVKPDYAGFILSEASFRYVPADRLKELSGLLLPEIRRVGVFVDASPETEAQYVKQGLIDVIQLHGREDNDHIKKLRNILSDYDEKKGKKTGIIKAVRVRDRSDILAAKDSEADILLMDAYVKGSSGGNGVSFNWELLEGFDRKYFLAGGLDPGNVAGAIRKMHPYGVDASSSLETGKHKDLEKMKAFAEAVRSTGEGCRE